MLPGKDAQMLILMKTCTEVVEGRLVTLRRCAATRRLWAVVNGELARSLKRNTGDKISSLLTRRLSVTRLNDDPMQQRFRGSACLGDKRDVARSYCVSTILDNGAVWVSI